MNCEATRRNIILAILIGGAYAFGSRIALGEITSISAEIKPLSLITNAVPGITGLGAEGEAIVHENLGVFVGLTHFHVRYSNHAVDEAREDKDKDEPIAKDILTNALTIGTRYYTNPTSNSWYAGGNGSIGTGHVKWVCMDTQVTDRAWYYQMGLQGGYRWQWDSGFLVRLGAGANWNVAGYRELKVNKSSSSISDDAAKDKVKDKREKDFAQVTSVFDLGLGYRF